MNIEKCGVPLPSASILGSFVEECREMLFPNYYGGRSIDVDKLTTQIAAGLAFAKESFSSKDELWECASEKAQKFVESLADLREILATDAEAHYNNDPAAHSVPEVLLCYPGMKAITNYRIAHRLVELGVPLIPRMIAELAHSETGIDINPEAKIGEYFAIDHGTGVVIGATCIIGSNVTIYQGVTLGAQNFPKNDDGTLVKGIARHPIIGDNVIIYANATILGRVHIGSGSVIGGNVWLTSDVPENTRLFNTLSAK